MAGIKMVQKSMFTIGYAAGRWLQSVVSTIGYAVFCHCRRFWSLLLLVLSLVVGRVLLLLLLVVYGNKAKL